MSQTFCIYCDESGHLERDRQAVMVLGAVWCSLEKIREVSARIREIKRAHGLASVFEIKWTKVSPSKLIFYRDLLDYFFDDDDLHFRALVIPNKAILRHSEFDQSHDDWYYKMYFDMLKVIPSPHSRYNIYLDVKDTRSGAKIAKLWEVLCNNMYDFERKIIEKVQTVRSDEVGPLQLADLLIGAVAYANRDLKTSGAKLALVQRMRQRSGYRLTLTTLLREQKVNIFRWEPKEFQ
jgi:hypothetical protein